MLLSEISREFLWSIGVQGTDKDVVHNYCKYFYDETFEKYADKKITLMEVGVLNGASLVMWHKYFKNAQKIIGIDRGGISSKWEPYFLEYLKTCQSKEIIQILYGDAYCDIFASSIKDDFDIIIDDGDHNVQSQIKFINLYLKKLKPNGILVIEDVFNPDVLLNSFQYHSKYDAKIIDLRDIPPGSNDSALFVISVKNEVCSR
jgi:predicted O-methyltransferase YrrM